MCVLLSLILCLLKRLSNSHFLMSFVSVVDYSFLLSFRFFILLSVPTVVGLPSSLLFFLFLFIVLLISLHFFIYILLLLSSHCTLSFLYHVFIPLVREEVRDKNIYMCIKSETKINFN